MCSFNCTNSSAVTGRPRDACFNNSGNVGRVYTQLVTVGEVLYGRMLLIQLKIHGQNLEGLYNDVPMRLLPVEYLPDDYKGPNAGTEKEIIGNNSHHTRTARQRTYYSITTAVMYGVVLHYAIWEWDASEDLKISCCP